MFIAWPLVLVYPDGIQAITSAGLFAPIPPVGVCALKVIEKMALVQALNHNQWKRMATAHKLGNDKNTLRRRLKRFDRRQVDR